MQIESGKDQLNQDRSIGTHYKDGLCMTFSSVDLEGTDCQKRCLAKDLSVLINNFPNVSPAGQFGKQAVGLAGPDSGWSLYMCIIELSTWCIHCFGNNFCSREETSSSEWICPCLSCSCILFLGISNMLSIGKPSMSPPRGDYLCPGHNIHNYRLTVGYQW